MPIRLETFRNLSDDPGDRAFITLMEAHEEGSNKVTACITFFGTSAAQAQGRAEAFLAEQRAREQAKTGKIDQRRKSRAR